MNYPIICFPKICRSACALFVFFTCAAVSAGNVEVCGNEDAPLTAEVQDSLYEKAWPMRQLDVKPEYPGGREKMIKYVFKSLKRLGFGNYTGDLTEMHVGFFIERDGSVTGARILKHGTEEQDLAVLEVLEEMPKWKPGEKDGKAVVTRYTARLSVPTDSKKGKRVSPKFPGGSNSLWEYLYTARSMSPAGSYSGRVMKVVVEFVVDKDGSVKDARVTRHGNAMMDETLLQAVRNMPRWEPATINGKPVRCRMRLPLTFGRKVVSHGKYNSMLQY